MILYPNFLYKIINTLNYFLSTFMPQKRTLAQTPIQPIFVALYGNEEYNGSNLVAMKLPAQEFCFERLGGRRWLLLQPCENWEIQM